MWVALPVGATACGSLLALDDLQYTPDESADANALADEAATAPPDAADASASAPDAADASASAPPDAADASASAPPDAADASASAPPDASDASASAPPDAADSSANAPPDASDASASAPPDASDASASAPPDASADGGPSGVTLILGGLTQPLGALAVDPMDGMNLYWVAAPGTTGGLIQTAPKTGGQVTTIAQMQMQPLDIAVDTQNVYWSVDEPPAGGGNVCNAMYASKTGSETGAACITKSPYATLRMTTTGNFVVFVTQAGAGINAQQHLGYAAKTTLAQCYDRLTQGPASAVAATQSNIFVSDGTQNPHIDAFALQAGLPVGPTLCGNGCGATTVVDLIVDPTATVGLWVTSDGNVYSAPVAMNTNLNGAKVGTIGNNMPQRIATDSSYVYLTAGNGSIYAMPIPGAGVGTALITLASGQDHPFGIAVDSNNVYWTTSDGAIRAVAVPGP